MTEASKIKIKVVSNITEQNLLNNKNNIYKIQLNQETNNKNNIVQNKINNELPNNIKINFKVNDTVKHKEEGIVGKVKFVNNEKIAILWNDGSRERFSLSDLEQLAYVDDSENQVSPLTNQLGGTEKINLNEQVNQYNNMDNLDFKSKSSPIDDLLQKALNELDDEYNDIEDGNPNKLKEKALERKVNSFNKKLEDNKINDIKEKATNEIISIMKDKGLIANNDMETLQKESIMKMDDSSFESFKTAILSMKSNNANNVIENCTEAELMLQKIKTGGPIIGSPSKYSIDSESSSRDLHSLAELKPKLNLDNFKNLQGITKPIQVISEQKTAQENMTDAIASIDWTVLSKIV